MITIDGATGEVILDAVKLSAPEVTGAAREFLDWADRYRTLGVRANADTPEDARRAREFGAEGIGLCRTEHMFFDADRISIVREMIMAPTTGARRTAVEQAPAVPARGLHRDLPGDGGAARSRSGCSIRRCTSSCPRSTGRCWRSRRGSTRSASTRPEDELDERRRKLEALHEANPMLGHRGCRLGITFPEIYEMQVRAILEAACAGWPRRA